MSLSRHLIKLNLPGVKDIIPAYTTVTIVYDIMQVKRITHISVHAFMMQKVQEAVEQCNWQINIVTNVIEIPVCYDTHFGLDLPEMARQKNISIQEIISIHTATTYQVYMIGFLPGFAYMGIVDDSIAAPRLIKPRTLVPAGSVGIAGNQTGVYPLDSPGGWNIIGKTPLQMFDAKKGGPCLLKPADNIKFFAINMKEFLAYSK